MNDPALQSCTAFLGHRRLASSPLPNVALAVKCAVEQTPDAQILIFDDATGRAIDFDTRGTDEDVIARHTPPKALTEPRGRGRPKLGVVAREVTLLPRHWDWLNGQQGGASVALRKLVEDARRNTSEKEQTRARTDAAYHFMSAMAGDLPGFEEAARALFAGGWEKFTSLIAPWPDDVRDHAAKLALGDHREDPGCRCAHL